MGLKDFFSRKAPQPRPEVDTRRDLTDAAENALLAILIPNFALMGLQAQNIPTAGSTGSLRSRGYLLGLTEGVMQQYTALHPTQEEFVAALASAFAITYGPCEWGWALDTVDEFQAGNQEATEGVLLGRRDAQIAYSDEPHKVIAGFWLINNGDQDALKYNLAGLRL